MARRRQRPRREGRQRWARRHLARRQRRWAGAALRRGAATASGSDASGRAVAEAVSSAGVFTPNPCKLRPQRGRWALKVPRNGRRRDRFVVFLFQARTLEDW
eukprot:3236730-Prymnesium_polylepis.1